jgi:hypothetical protein
MSLFARLFGRSRPTPELAVGDLCVHLLKMASFVEGVLDIKETAPTKSPRAFYEVLWAYLSLADRMLFAQFGPEVRDKAMSHMDAMLPTAIIDALWLHMPGDLRTKHIQEFAENMRSAEQEYGRLQVTGLPKPDDLFYRCASNVVERISPTDRNPLGLSMLLMKTMTDMPMGDLVRNLGKAVGG